MRIAVAVAMLALGLPLAAVTQETGVLRITVVLTDADGNVTPIPRVVLLVSDNPATREPRRVRTGADGAVEIALPPGNYTVESDAPVTLGGRRYIVDADHRRPRRQNVLSLTAANADIDTDTGAAAASGVAPMRADGAAIFNKWRDSVVEIWTPTAHASGFVIDARGLIATTTGRSVTRPTWKSSSAAAASRRPSTRGNDASPPPRSGQAASNRFKVAGRVIASDRQQGVAIIWIDPAAVSAIPVDRPDCTAAAGAAVKYEEKVVALVAPMLEPKSAIPGTVGRVETAVFRRRLASRLAVLPAGRCSMRTAARSASPSLTTSARIRAAANRGLRAGQRVQRVGDGGEEIAGATPPPATRLRIEMPRAATASPQAGGPEGPAGAIPIVSSSNFDISLMTPAMVDGDLGAVEPAQRLRRLGALRSTSRRRCCWCACRRSSKRASGRRIARGAAVNTGRRRCRPWSSFSAELPAHARVLRRRGGRADSSASSSRRRVAGPRADPRGALRLRAHRLRSALRIGALRPLFREVAEQGRQPHHRSHAVHPDLSRSPVACEPTPASLL